MMFALLLFSDIAVAEQSERHLLFSKTDGDFGFCPVCSIINLLFGGKKIPLPDANLDHTIQVVNGNLPNPVCSELAYTVKAGLLKLSPNSLVFDDVNHNSNVYTIPLSLPSIVLDCLGSAALEFGTCASEDLALTASECNVHGTVAAEATFKVESSSCWNGWKPGLLLKVSDLAATIKTAKVSELNLAFDLTAPINLPPKVVDLVKNSITGIVDSAEQALEGTNLMETPLGSTLNSLLTSAFKTAIGKILPEGCQTL